MSELESSIFNKINHKLFYRIIGYVICCLTCFMVSGGVSSDVYFMINSAKTMLCEGFYYSDSLSMFQNMPFYTQKWAMCFLTYFVYNIGKMPALMIGMYILGFIRSILLFETINIINPKSKTKNLFISAFACLLLNVYSLDFRPSVIADCFLFLEIMMFEKHKKTKLNAMNVILLCVGSMLISISVMWFHSTMWPMCILFALPYLFDNHKINALFNICRFNKLKASNSKTWPFAVSIIVMFLSGLLQPNGLKQFWYMLCVILSPDSLSFAQEYRKITFGDGWSIAIMILFICIIICISQANKVNLRFVYLFIGTLLMVMTAQRCLEYFIPAVFFLTASCMAESNMNTFKHIQESFEIYIAVIIGITFVSAIDLSYNIHAYKYGDIDEILGYKVDDFILESEIPNNAKIYCSFDLGSYLEFLGYKPYIDGRLEAFSYMINQQYDVLTEYADTYDGTIQDLAYLENKYDFDYYVVLNTSEFVDSLEYVNSDLIYHDNYYSVYAY